MYNLHNEYPVTMCGYLILIQALNIPINTLNINMNNNSKKLFKTSITATKSNHRTIFGERHRVFDERQELCIIGQSLFTGQVSHLCQILLK